MHLTRVKSQLVAFLPSVKGSPRITSHDNTHAAGSSATDAVQLSGTHSRLPDKIYQDYYAGPISSTFCLTSVNSRLSTVEQPFQIDEFHSNERSNRVTPAESPQSHTRCDGQDQEPASMEQMSLADVECYIDTFQDVFGVLHPVPAVLEIRSQASQLLRATQRSLYSRPSRPGNSGPIEMFKCVLAIGVVCNEGSSTPLSKALYQSLEPLIADAIFARSISHEFRTLLLLAVGAILLYPKHPTDL
jgi:hypothetical protein